MKRRIILLPVAALLAFLAFSSYKTGPTATTGLDYSGASGGGAAGCGGIGCHNESVSLDVDPTVTLLDGTGTPVTSYTPGATYTLVVTATNTGTTSLPKFGFQLTCTSSSSMASLGTFVAPPGTHFATAGIWTVLEHSAPMSPFSGTGGAGTVYKITTTWTAPPAGSGELMFHAVVNAVNNNNAADAIDQWGAGVSDFISEESSTVGAITGGLNICPNTTSALTCTPAGGTWSSSTPAVGTISTTGVVTGIAAGTTTISYVTTVGIATAIVTVMAAPGPVTGTPTVCIGSTTTLGSSPAGGTWSSSAPTIGTVAPTTGVVGGIASGTVIISYINSLGCSSTKIVTVNAHGAATITGTNNVCVGTTITLSNLTPGGTWSSSAPAKATVNATTGVVTGVAVGTATISYTATNTCGVSTTTKTINVLPAGSCTSAVGTTAATETGLSIYPNPNNGAFTMNLHTDLNEEARVIVCNISGEKVKEFTTMTNTAVDMRLPHVAGMYFVSVSTSQGNFVSRLVIQ